MSEIKFRDLDEYITTDFETTLAIAREINKILWQQRMEKLMPAVAQKLVDAGVDFSNADISKL